MTRPNITLDQLQQAVLSLRRSQRHALHVGSTNGNAVEKIRVDYASLNTVIYFLGTQERIAELHGRDTND